MTAYSAFLDKKTQASSMAGFEPTFLPSWLFPFQEYLTRWGIERGRAAFLADCGMGKGPMALVWAQNIVEHTNKPVLILTPLAVGAQFITEAVKFDIPGVVRSREGGSFLSAGIVVANYEQLHRFDPADFAGVVCDESSILKHFTGATQKAVTRFLLKVPYRLLGTATPSPNDYIELGTSSEALGELGYSDMLSRFFKQTGNETGHRMQQIKLEKREKMAVANAKHYGKLSLRVSEQMGQWRLKGHAVTPFWRWVASWAKACRTPSDLGFDDNRFVLPALIEREHIIEPRRLKDGMLFTIPAVGLQEEREERRRTLDERCELAAELVAEHQYSVIWCHMNSEGDRLEQIIPYSIQVSGSDTDDYKETVAEWFKGNRCICGDKRFSAKLAAWQRGLKAIGSDGIENIVRNELRKRSNTPSGTARNDAPISPSTTKSTNQNIDSARSGRRRKTKSGAGATDLIPNTEKCTSSRLRNGKRPIQSSDSTSVSGNTESPQRTTGAFSPANTADALSAAGRNRETSGPVVSTLTTATRLESLGDCSARIATLDLESLAMIRPGLSEQHCMCGHRGGPRRLISKAKIFGFGLNLQFCAHVVTFATHSYEQFYQSVRRCWRFGQTSPVTVDIIATEGERNVRESMTRKAAQADQMFTELVSHMNDAAHMARINTAIHSEEIPAWLS